MKNRLLEKLTIDEKIQLLNGVGDWHTYSANGKIDSIMMTDGPHGLRKVVSEKTGDINGSAPSTCFPTASAIAASWDEDVVVLMAEAIAREAIKEDISIVLGCGVNIKRSPLCGRNFEYFSEDPLLAGRMGTAYIKAMQHSGVGTSLKHFAANSQEQYRQTSNSQVDERALREIYLSAFEMIVKEAKPTTIMACYNRVNGQYGCANTHLLKDILRDEWGYEGAVISDWGATVGVIDCLKAGLDLEMPDNLGYHTEVIRKALENGAITEELIDEHAGRILDAMVSIKSGDNPFVNKYKQVTSATEGLSDDNCVSADASMNLPEADFCDSQHEIARQIEDQCAVLLKNDNGALPVPKGNKIIVIGDLAANVRYQGGGSSHINATKVSDPVRSLEAAGYDVSSARGYDAKKQIPERELESKALELVRSCSSKDNCTILYFIGLTDYCEGEGYDRKDMSIPDNQTSLLAKIKSEIDRCGSQANIVAVSFGGSPMDYSFEKYTEGILHMHLGGQAVGDSIADLISGKINPSGKLAETIPFSAEDTPSSRYFANGSEDVEYRESIFVGYRYYESYDIPVRFPFGYGLSYTSFEYSDMRVEKGQGDNDYVIKCNIKNIGGRAGAETAQLYVCPPEGSMMRSKIELRDFCKVYLEPGEEKEVSFHIGDRAFSIFNCQANEFSVIAGQYKIAVASSVREPRLTAMIDVAGIDYPADERELYPAYFGGQSKGMNIPKDQFEKLYGRELSRLNERGRGQMDMTCSFGRVSRMSLVGRMFRGVVAIALGVMCKGMDKNDPARMMTTLGVEEGALESLISLGGGAFSKKLVDILILNANGKYGKAFVRLFSR